VKLLKMAMAVNLSVLSGSRRCGVDLAHGGGLASVAKVTEGLGHSKPAPRTGRVLCESGLSGLKKTFRKAWEFAEVFPGGRHETLLKQDRPKTRTLPIAGCNQVERQIS
jgi:hypothetical protein